MKPYLAEPLSLFQLPPIVLPITVLSAQTLCSWSPYEIILMPKEACLQFLDQKIYCSRFVALPCWYIQLSNFTYVNQQAANSTKAFYCSVLPELNQIVASIFSTATMLFLERPSFACNFQGCMSPKFRSLTSFTQKLHENNRTIKWCTTSTDISIYTLLPKCATNN